MFILDLTLFDNLELNTIQMERKDFIKKMAVGGSILLTAPVLLNSCSDGTDEAMDDVENNKGVTIDLSSNTYQELQTVGGYVYTGNIIVVRVSDSQYIALSSICTHQGCMVEYSSGSTEIVCPCHGSKYTTGGVVTQGPATANLKKYTVTNNGNTLNIK